MPLGQPESADDPAVHIAIIAVVKISGNSSGGTLKFSLNSFHCPDNFWVFRGENPEVPDCEYRRVKCMVIERTPEAFKFIIIESFQNRFFNAICSIILAFCIVIVFK